MFLGVDFRRKYIIMEVEGKEVIVDFYDSFWRGVYDVEVWGLRAAKIKSVYPGFVRRIQERALLVKVELRHLRRRLSKQDR